MDNGRLYNLNISIMKNIRKYIDKHKIKIIGFILFLIIVCCILYNQGDKHELQMDKIHNTLLKNLEKLIPIFEKHKIRYWITFGTLLGSIREGEIIKHDDDIDLGVFEEDFLRIQNDDNIHQDLKKMGLHLIISNPEINHNKIVSLREDNDYTKGWLKPTMELNPPFTRGCGVTLVHGREYTLLTHKQDPSYFWIIIEKPNILSIILFLS